MTFSNLPQTTNYREMMMRSEAKEKRTDFETAL